MNDRPLKVLVVENDDVLRHLYAMELQKDPTITTCEASTLVQGATIARQQEKFVVLIDLTLEDAKDLEALIVMKRIIPGATRVVITGADSEVRDAALKAGAHLVIEKAGPDSHGQGFRDAIRRAVEVHDQELINQSALEITERIKVLLKLITEKK